MIFRKNFPLEWHNNTVPPLYLTFNLDLPWCLIVKAVKRTARQSFHYKLVQVAPLLNYQFRPTLVPISR